MATYFRQHSDARDRADTLGAQTDDETQQVEISVRRDWRATREQFVLATYDIESVEIEEEQAWELPVQELFRSAGGSLIERGELSNIRPTHNQRAVAGLQGQSQPVAQSRVLRGSTKRPVIEIHRW